jgi:hypothetical protein
MRIVFASLMLLGVAVPTTSALSDGQSPPEPKPTPVNQLSWYAGGAEVEAMQAFDRAQAIEAERRAAEEAARVAELERQREAARVEAERIAAEQAAAAAAAAEAARVALARDQRAQALNNTPPPRPALGGSVWDALAQCESGGNWAYNGPSGFDGGLQFDPSTWTAMGGGQYAPYAYMASREQQIAIAERTLTSSGWGAWPACSSRLGLR